MEIQFEFLAQVPNTPEISGLLASRRVNTPEISGVFTSVRVNTPEISGVFTTWAKNAFGFPWVSDSQLDAML